MLFLFLSLCPSFPPVLPIQVLDAIAFEQQTTAHVARWVSLHLSLWVLSPHDLVSLATSHSLSLTVHCLWMWMLLQRCCVTVPFSWRHSWNFYCRKFFCFSFVFSYECAGMGLIEFTNTFFNPRSQTLASVLFCLSLFHFCWCCISSLCVCIVHVWFKHSQTIFFMFSSFKGSYLKGRRASLT